METARRDASLAASCARPSDVATLARRREEGEDEALSDAVAALANDALEGEHDDDEDDDDQVQDDASRSRRRRTTSAFNRSNGLVLSATYLTVTYGGAPAYYSLWLGEQCTSTVVVHLQFLGDAQAGGKAVGVRLSCDRLEFTPRNFREPQIVRVEMAEPCGGSHMVVHRVFSLDKNYDRLESPTLVVKTERSAVGSLLSLGGMLVHKRKNAQGEPMAPRLAANRTIDLATALASAAAAASVAQAVATATQEGDSLLVASSSQQQQLEASPVFASHLAAGHSFSAVVVKPQCGVEAVLVWGMNANGELGVGSTTPTVEPVPLALPPTPHSEPVSVASISCGKHHAALVTTHGRLFTWGNNKHGQLGIGDFSNADAPREVAFAGALFRTRQRALRINHALDHAAANVTQVACGSFHTLFVTHQQHVLAMGYNQAGQLGLGHRLQQLKGWRSCTPAMVETLRDSCILDLAAGQNHSACVLSNGDVFVWGCGGDGRLGVPLRARQSECEVSPVPVQALRDVGVKARAVRCGARHTAVLSDRDLLYLWGANEFGQLGLGDKRARVRPNLHTFPAFVNEGVVDVALGEFHSACVTWAGDAYIWGLDLSGDQSTHLDQRCTPECVLLPENEGALRVACGWAHTNVITQASRENGRPQMHVHRRKEQARQFAARQQEAAKWRRVTNALTIMGRHQRNGRSKGKSASPKANKISFAQVVSSAWSQSGRWLNQQHDDEEIARHARVLAEAFVRGVADEGIKRVNERRPSARSQRRKKDKKRTARIPLRAKPPKPVSQGVFFQNALHMHPPPRIPPPCGLLSASSPRQTFQSISTTNEDVSLSPRPTPPPSCSRKTNAPLASRSPRSLRSPATARYLVADTSKESLTSSCASLLSALRDDQGEEECEVRPPALAKPQESKRLTVIESLLYKPSFSLASHLAGGVREVRYRPLR